MNEIQNPILGQSELWAAPRGLDESYQKLIRLMDELALRQFFEYLQNVDRLLVSGQEREQFESEFLLLQSLPPEPMRIVLTHPVWIFRLRYAHYALEQSPGNVKELLNLLPEVVLASFMVAGKDLDIDLNLTPGVRFSLPGTRLSISIPHSLTSQGPVHVSLRAIRSGLCRLSIGSMEPIDFIVRGSRIFPFYISEHPIKPWLVAVHDFLEIDPYDHTFVTDWINSSPAPDSEISFWSERLAESLDLIRECSPLLYQEMRYILRTIVPVISLHPESLLSESSRNFWCAILCSMHPGITLCEALVHEYRHILLNAILEADSIFSEDSPADAGYYSPWRKDPRPLPAILHAIYSFSEVAAFYWAYLQSFGSIAPQADRAEVEFIANTYRLRIACEELISHGKFTSFGFGFVKELQARIEEMCENSRELQADVRDAAMKEAMDHRLQWASVSGQVKI